MSPVEKFRVLLLRRVFSIVSTPSDKYWDLNNVGNSPATLWKEMEILKR